MIFLATTYKQENSEPTLKKLYKTKWKSMNFVSS